MTVRWLGDEVYQRLYRQISSNMDLAVQHVKGEVQKSINRGNADGSSPSRPGEPPKKVSGRLFQSIATDKIEGISQIVGVIGTNDEKAPRLELGFVGTDAQGRNISQAPRPFLRPGLDNSASAVERILALRGDLPQAR